VYPTQVRVEPEVLLVRKLSIRDLLTKSTTVLPVLKNRTLTRGLGVVEFVLPDPDELFPSGVAESFPAVAFSFIGGALSG
jgi:hypothetical protein